MNTRIGAIDKEKTQKLAEDIGELKLPQPSGYKILILQKELKRSLHV